MSEQLGFDFNALATEPTPDEPARRRIATDLDATLFVEAGAGAGKTTALVGRIVALVVDGVAMGSIAAITFSEKAAAELRNRLRRELSVRATAEDHADAGGSDIGAPRCAAALAELDQAAIGTLHAFARRVLYEFPIEAGLPPGFDVLDELESGLAFEERWSDLLDRLLDDPAPAGGAAEGGTEFVQLCEFDGFGVTRGVRRIADDFRANWDLVDERVRREPPPPLHVDVGPLLAGCDELLTTTAPPGDTQAEILAGVSALIRTLRAAADLRATLRAVDKLADQLRKGVTRGDKKYWAPWGGEAARDALRLHEQVLADEAAAIVKAARDYRQALLGSILGRFTLEAAGDRAAAGTLEFHDLLVVARRLLSTHPEARRALHERYQRVLLDEFQDTDPIQLEIAVRITADPAHPAQDTDWRELRPLPGRLFVVGDPKQSIYRFRRADIAQYLSAAGQVGADTEVLSANFRSSAAVIAWVNHVFDALITFTPDVQPRYQHLDVCRPAGTAHGTVRLIGSDGHDDVDVKVRGSAEELRTRESVDVAATVAIALAEGWPVYDDDPEVDGPRPCRPGDIAVLLPTRTPLPALEIALRDLTVPYRAENSSIVYVTSEIRHLMLALRAADDPTDQLALVAALRTPLYGCSDVELYQYRAGGGRWNIWATPPEAVAGGQVATAIGHLRSIAERIGWASPADLLAALVEERRLLEAALDGPDARDVWRRVRYVVEQARAWSDAGGRGVRRYLGWVRLQAAEGRMADTILPEHDHDAVRVMTIHAAKGLEFPITVVAGLTTRPNRSQGPGVVWPPGTWTLTRRDGDSVYDAFKPLDEQMSDAERRRLLYVACTRAVDHLVVSLHRQSGRKSLDEREQWSTFSSAELLAAAGAAAVGAGGSPLVAEATAFHAHLATAVELPWADSAEWGTERDRALSGASHASATSATRLAEELDRAAAGDVGLAKEPVNLDLPPWQRGRYGTAVGRAVHGVLQFADLRADLDDDVPHGSDIDRLARAQCAAEGILGLESRVAALARSALAAPIVGAALDFEHWRELFVAAQVGDRVVEGYIDLLVRTPDGYVIVDYKTDHWHRADQREERIARYRRQLAAYALALRPVLGETAVAGVLVRCRVDGPAEEIALDGWIEAVAELDAQLASSTGSSARSTG